MWELDCEESWAPKNWYFWTVVLEKTLESPLDCKEIQPVHPKGDQSWVFLGRYDAKAETPVLWPPHAKSWLIGKDSDAGRDWGQEEKGMTEDEMAGWHHWFDGHESEWTPGVGDGQGGLVCCDSWGRKKSHTTERLIWSDVLGTMLPAGPTKMNKDLNSKFCFQKQMSCSRTWTKKWGRVRTQYNGYYSKTKTQKITSVGEDTEILEPLCIASKNVEWSSCYTKQFGGSSQN